MTTQIQIEITHGRVDDEDRERAETAALKVLADAGVTVAQAFGAFKSQWAEFDDYEKMTGLARIWINAEEAANLALTEGWANSDGAGCAISA